MTAFLKKIMYTYGDSSLSEPEKEKPGCTFSKPAEVLNIIHQTILY